MKIGISGDLHLNKSVYKGVNDEEFTDLPFRNGDFMRGFRWNVDKALEEEVDLFIIPGDVYEHFDPANTVRGFFSAQLERLHSKKIPVIILIGNHDVCKKGHALEDIHKLGLKAIKVVEEPTVFDYKGEVRIMLFPYSLLIERGILSEKEALLKFLDETKEKRQSDIPTFFFGHFGVYGAKLNSDEDGKEGMVNKNPDSIRVDDLDKIGADYVVLGDYHRHQVLPTKKCFAMYTGSVERTDFDEADQEKGFIIYDSEAEEVDGYGKCRFMKYPNPRPMLELRGNLTELKEQLYEADATKYQNAVVKTVFEGTSAELVDYSTGFPDLSKEISERLNSIFMLPKQCVKFVEQEQKASIVMQEIMEKGHLEDSDVINAVKEIVDEKIEDEEEAKITKQMAEGFYQDAKARSK